MRKSAKVQKHEGTNEWGGIYPFVRSRVRAFALINRKLNSSISIHVSAANGTGRTKSDIFNKRRHINWDWSISNKEYVFITCSVYRNGYSSYQRKDESSIFI